MNRDEEEIQISTAWLRAIERVNGQNGPCKTCGHTRKAHDGYEKNCKVQICDCTQWERGIGSEKPR